MRAGVERFQFRLAQTSQILRVYPLSNRRAPSRVDYRYLRLSDPVNPITPMSVDSHRNRHEALGIRYSTAKACSVDHLRAEEVSNSAPGMIEWLRFSNNNCCISSDLFFAFSNCLRYCGGLGTWRSALLRGHSPTAHCTQVKAVTFFPLSFFAVLMHSLICVFRAYWLYSSCIQPSAHMRLILTLWRTLRHQKLAPDKAG